MTYSEYILGFFLSIILLNVIIYLLRNRHDSYLEYIDCFLVNGNHKILEKLYRLFRAYFVLGGILAVALSFIKSDFCLSYAPNYFYLYFLSSCFFLFIARIYTTTDIISFATHDETHTRSIRIDRIRRHMGHINFLAFFGMITGILGFIISLIQNPETIQLWYDKIFILEFRMSTTIVPILKIVAIPFLFSLSELVLIRIRNNETTT